MGQLTPKSDKSNTVYDPLESFPCILSDLRGVELQNGGMIRADFRLNQSVECEIRVSALEEDADNSRRNESEYENERIFEARFQPGPVRLLFSVRSTSRTNTSWREGVMTEMDTLVLWRRKAAAKHQSRHIRYASIISFL